MNRMPPPLPERPRKPRHGQRMHGIMVAEYTTKNFWLLLFPLIRGLLALQFDLFSWVQGAWFDLLIIAGILGTAILRWYCVSYEIQRDGILIHRGVLVKSCVFLPRNRLASASFEASFPYRLLGAVRVRLETDAGGRRRSEFRGTLSTQRAHNLSDALQNAPCSVSNSSGFHYRPVWLQLFLFSVLSSDSLSGVLIASTFLSLAGAFIGRSLSDEVLETISELAAKAAVNIPPIAVTFSLILLGGWLFSFVRNMLRYLRFHLWRDSPCGDVLIETGIFARRWYRLTLGHIHVIDLRQTLLTRLLRIASIYVQCTGYGKAKEEHAVLLPATGKSKALECLRQLLPEWMPRDGKSPANIRPSPASFLAYTGVPLALLPGIPAIGWLFIHLFPLLQPLILWAVILAMVPVLWAFALGCFNFTTAGMELHNGLLTLRYGRRLTLHTVVIPIQKVSQLTLRQSPLQRPSQCCDVLFSVRAEGRSRHRIQGISMKNAQKLRDIIHSSRNPPL